jgi:hypothetical protein
LRFEGEGIVTKTMKWIVFGIGGTVAGYLLYKKFMAAPATANPTATRIYRPAAMPLLPAQVRNNPNGYSVSAVQIRGIGTLSNQRWVRSGNVWVYSPVTTSTSTITTSATGEVSAVAGLDDDFTLEGDCL